MLSDDIIARQVQLFRLTAGERAKVLRILRTMEEELVEMLVYSGRKLTDIGREDKARLLREAQALISKYYGDVSDQIGETLEEVGKLEASATASSLGAIYAGAIAPALPSETVLKRLVGNTLIDGAPNAEWWKRQSGDMQFRFANAVRQGLAASESNDEIIRRIRGRAQGYQMVEGKRVYNFAGGLMDVTRSNAAALVQTAVQTVANRARMDTFEENDDIIKGYRQLSTLDSHTTPICVAYSGKEWNKDKQPINGNTLPFISSKGATTGTPRHWNCRSLIVPITKTFRELGLDVDEMPTSTRSASGGPVAANESFDAYLKRRGDKFADDLLGPGRAQMWRDGKITLNQLVDGTGRPLTLKQLRRLYER